jgi:hypothetical protein
MLKEALSWFYDAAAHERLKESYDKLLGDYHDMRSVYKLCCKERKDYINLYHQERGMRWKLWRVYELKCCLAEFRQGTIQSLLARIKRLEKRIVELESPVEVK